MTDDEKRLRTLKKQIGLWLHRTLIKFGLLSDPRRNKHAQQVNSETAWERRWNILWIGLRTMLLLLLVTGIIGVAWMIYQPSEQTILISTMFILVGYVVITILVLYRMLKTRREQLQAD